MIVRRVVIFVSAFGWKHSWNEATWGRDAYVVCIAGMLFGRVETFPGLGLVCVVCYLIGMTVDSFEFVLRERPSLSLLVLCTCRMMRLVFVVSMVLPSSRLHMSCLSYQYFIQSWHSSFW